MSQAWEVREGFLEEEFLKGRPEAEKAGAEKDVPGRRNKSKGLGCLQRQSLAAWEKVRNAEKAVLEPFLSGDFIPRAWGRAVVAGVRGWGFRPYCCVIRSALEKDHSGSGAEGTFTCN